MTNFQKKQSNLAINLYSVIMSSAFLLPTSRSETVEQAWRYFNLLFASYLSHYDQNIHSTMFLFKKKTSVLQCLYCSLHRAGVTLNGNAAQEQKNISEQLFSILL